MQELERLTNPYDWTPGTLKQRIAGTKRARTALTAAHTSDRPALATAIGAMEENIDEVLGQTQLMELASQKLLHRNIEVIPVVSGSAFAIVRGRVLPNVGFLVHTRPLASIERGDSPTYVSFQIVGDRVSPPFELAFGDPLFSPEIPEDFGTVPITLSCFQEGALEIGTAVERLCVQHGITELVVSAGSQMVVREQRFVLPADVFGALKEEEDRQLDRYLGRSPVPRILAGLEGFDLGRSNVL